MSGWTEARVDLLRQRWSAGATGKAIAEELSQGGWAVSRNAVIAKADRLGLERRPTPLGNAAAYPARQVNSGNAIRRKHGLPPLSEPKWKAQLRGTRAATSHMRAAGGAAITAEAAKATERKDATAPKLARGRSCRWPEGDPREPGFHFCGEPAEAGKPYCPEHCGKAYQRKRPAANDADPATAAANDTLNHTPNDMGVQPRAKAKTLPGRLTAGLQEWAA